MEDVKSQPFDCKKARDQDLPDLKQLDHQEEIVAKIISGKLYAFLGAGISVESGLPDWAKLLDCLLMELPSNLPRRREIVEEIHRYRETDLVMAFELLKQVPGNESDLSKKITLHFTELKKSKNGFDGDPVPNDLHHLISRLPIRRMITTNYDRFLEQAAIAGGRPRLDRTRDDGVDLFDVIMNEENCLIKIHGSTDKPRSIVAARSDYDRTYSGGFVNDWLEKCFVFNSFLFIGYSLRDIDIVSMIRHAKSSVDPKVRIGPHYGIFFDDHHGDLLVKYLNTSLELRIDKVFIREKASNLAQQRDKELLTRTTTPEEKRRRLSSKISEEMATLRYEAIHGLLVSLQGSIALRKSVGVNFGREMSDGFHSHLAKISRWAWQILGIDEIRVSLCKTPTQRSIKTVYRKRGSYESNEPLSVSSSTNEAYLLLRETDYLYLSTEKETSAAAFSGDASYKSGLVVSIAHGGAPVGLLEVYSIINKAFSVDHLNALRAISKLIAYAFSDNDLRMAHHQPDLDFRTVQSLVKTSPLYNQYKSRIKFITYDIDYTNGRLNCKFDPKDGFPGSKNTKDHSFLFGESSLATHVFLSGRTVHGILKASGAHESPEFVIVEANGTTKVILSTKGIEYFDIKPETWVYATTIRSKGQIVQILVAWYVAEENIWPIDAKPTGCTTVFERIKRIIRLIQNDDSRLENNQKTRSLSSLKNPPVHHRRHRQTAKSSRASKFIERVGRALDQNRWKQHHLSRGLSNNSIRFFEGELRKLLEISIHPLLQFHKVRVWVFDHPIGWRSNNSPNHVKILASQASDRALFPVTAPGVKVSRKRKPIDGYVDGIERSCDTLFTRYTLSRFDRDPYARWQDQSMYGEEDVLNSALDKADNGFWATAPLVWNGSQQGQRILVGFISADCHVCTNDGKPRDDTQHHLMEFQRCALDLISHVAVRCVVPLWHSELFTETVIR